LLLDPATFEQLGRVVWAAMLLEEAAYSVCSFVVPLPPDQPHSTPIGGLIATCVNELEGNPDEADRLRWLSNAASLLERRNQLVQSIPFWMSTLDDEHVSVPSPVMVVHYTRITKRNPTARPVFTEIEHRSLRLFRRQLQDARGRWETHCRPLSTP
jgi:hypothetical protein